MGYVLKCFIRGLTDSPSSKPREGYSINFHFMGGGSAWRFKPLPFKGAMSRIFSISLNSKIYICVAGNLKNNGPFLLTVAILVH